MGRNGSREPTSYRTATARARGRAHRTVCMVWSRVSAHLQARSVVCVEAQDACALATAGSPAPPTSRPPGHGAAPRRARTHWARAAGRAFCKRARCASRLPLARLSVTARFRHRCGSERQRMSAVPGRERAMLACATGCDSDRRGDSPSLAQVCPEVCCHPREPLHEGKGGGSPRTSETSR